MKTTSNLGRVLKNIACVSTLCIILGMMLNAYGQPNLPVGPVIPSFIGVPTPIGSFPDPYYTNTGAYPVGFSTGYMNSPFTTNPTNTVNVGPAMQFYPTPTPTVANSEVRFFITNSLAGISNSLGAQFGIYQIGGNAFSTLIVSIRTLDGTVLVSNRATIHNWDTGWHYFPANIPRTTNTALEARIESLSSYNQTPLGIIGNLPMWVGGIRFEPEIPQTEADGRFHIVHNGNGGGTLTWSTTNYSGYVLQSSPSPEGTYSDLTNYTTTTNGGWISTSIDTMNAKMFYRLRNP